MTNTNWWAYVESVVPDARPAAIADRAGFDKSNITRWKQGAMIQPSFAVKFARAYGRPVVEALAACGLITPEDAALHEVKVGVSDLTDRQLLEELSARLDRLQAAVVAKA
ncbi:MULTISPECIES: helix-turn-helix transcriptional regulator [unclassified Cryobacterium]|uniref:helix-turn-helix domain-containing protein n=1 Tax=unclassified Cryobacterium TaxID=2649013 RepID=UPI002AB33ED5|nr:MULTISPECIES: helix-turn-helix transcriptional regulator [unclassified Cryobacterium]MDY7528484.1 helix-turn-helix transcriptional regulator [Cryobacterium sp. 10C2]MDY7555771.1 helix-turn-helix transcriptional regulator [Cryobacterium sp. 10C3]MEB0286195.1 helix-turn-helix transcriptional regulator [Cryobacterium sp. 10S3]MEB0289204.1 helix-turn-helix transcriptional regulator [Cryobacterium sp. 10C2]WPX12253.1 helix-turn-helix transcriptional regulator [Cryobacterium sp. 10S3]